MPATKIGDISLCPRIHGKGQPLFLTTGFAGAQNMRYAQVHAFGISYRVITFDNRGFRKSDKPTGPYTATTLAGNTIG